MTFWKSQHFKALQKDWYKRLEDLGFRDAEKIVGDELVLRQCAAHMYKDTDELSRQHKADYYNILSQQVHHATFSNNVDQLILSLYADGKKIKAICDELEKIGERRCRGTIRYTIRKYEMSWGMKEYTPQQLNRKVK